MEGKLGALFIGRRQVGGFKDWDFRLNMATGNDRDGFTVREVKTWKLTSWEYWLFSPLPVDTEVTLKLVPGDGNAYWTGQGKNAARVTEVLNTLVHSRLEIIGTEELVGHKLGEGDG